MIDITNMNHNLELKVQELVWNHKKNGIHVESFIFEPSAIEEEEMGNLYILCRHITKNDNP